MFIDKDILKLNLDLALASSTDDEFFEVGINSKFSESNLSYQDTLNQFLKQKIRNAKAKSQQLDYILVKENNQNQQDGIKNDQEQNSTIHNQIPNVESGSQIILQQQRYGSYVDEISALSKIQFQRVTKLKKNNTNLHGFNRIGARQLFIRTIVDVNPEFNIQYIYNTGIGTHSEKENVISKVIQNTAKNMFGQKYELAKASNNPGLLEFYKKSDFNYSLNPSQEQLQKVVFGGFDPKHFIE